MDFSRTPLREALNQLRQEGLVNLIRHHGYQVAPVTLHDLRDPFELRRVLESESAYLAATRRGPEEVVELRRLAELPYSPGVRKTYKTYLRNNIMFHEAVASCTQNARLASTIRSLLEQLQRPICLGFDIGIDSTTATGEHLNLVNAIEAREPELARQIMVEQIGAGFKPVSAERLLTFSLATSSLQRHIICLKARRRYRKAVSLAT